MNQRLKAAITIASLAPTFAWATCDVKSGPQTAALVELYTSEGCSSCPPADKRLSQFPSSGFTLEQAVPIALHVDYWDYIGWKDPFAQPPFTERQAWLVHANEDKTSFTPHFFVSGREVRDWRGDLVEAVKRVNAEPAHASVRIHAETMASGALSVAASAVAPTPNDQLALFVAVTEDKLVSKVASGENGGATLSHEHVVREWIGPIALTNGHVEETRVIVPRPNWNAAQLGVVGFVQDLRTGHVLQAAGEASCIRS